MSTIENLKHFVAVVENKGVLKAAEKANISASSITRSVQIIEENVGFSLFDRVGRNVQLNEAGMRFYGKTKNLLGNYDSLLKDGHLGPQTLSGHYSIGSSHFLCEHVLSSVMTQLSAQHPHATFEVFSLDSQNLIKKLHSGEMDIGISFSPKLSDSLDSQVLFTGELYLCGGRKHILAGKPFSEVKTKISSLPAIIHRPTDSIERCDNHPMFKKHGIVPQIQMYWDSDYFAVSVLSKNIHWSMLPKFVIDADPRVVQFSHPKDWNAKYDISLVWNKKKTISGLRESFIKLV